MQAASPCISCPSLQHGFCAAIFDKQPDVNQQNTSWQHHRKVASGRLIASRNEPSDDVLVMCGGWGCRYVQLADGRRHILGFLLPGDLFSAASVYEGRLHFSVKALTDTLVSEMRRNEIQSRVARNPDAMKALASCCASESEAADKTQTVLGKSSAEERIAHLFLQLMHRITARNVIREQRYPFPLRQIDIADAVGLTPVHVSRVMSLFRERNIVDLSEGILKVFNLRELQRIGCLSLV